MDESLSALDAYSHYYPTEISNERCKQYSTGEILRPLEVLEGMIEKSHPHRCNMQAGASVVHWFKRDLRIKDNRALKAASEVANRHAVPVIGLYLISPQDFEAHATSAVRVDFILRNLAVLSTNLSNLGIPLYVETCHKRWHVVERVLDICQAWGANHLFTNLEYEVDELRRETSLIQMAPSRGIAVFLEHDTCVVWPGQIQKFGHPIPVYSPWYRAWIDYLIQYPLKVSESPAPNSVAVDSRFQSLFDCPIPSAPPSRQLTEEESRRFRKLWPAGEDEAWARLSKFLAERLGQYTNKRNFPAESATSVLSVHFAAGTLSARSAVVEALAMDRTKVSDLSNKIALATGWIAEIAWRDFYKHVVAYWPYVCMNKPFKLECTGIKWNDDEILLQAWKEGMTGYPIVDAAMRQLNYMGYMHNRCRMIVASFLSKHLLLDWRLGERYFMSKLVDGDFASNNGGWGFSTSTGIDPQPYLRVFNPLLQSEKFDPQGLYIRKWVPELQELDDKTIHDPWHRDAADKAQRNGYPRPVVAHKLARDRALQRYREGLENALQHRTPEGQN